MTWTKTYSSDKFTWTENMGVTERSEHGAMGLNGRLFPFKVKSTRTGKVEEFRYLRTLMDDEGDAIAWVFQAVDSQVEIHILND